jgi:hypothetical protein
MNRQALHAHRLAFRHPQTGERVEFESPISQDMRSVLEWLRFPKNHSSSEKKLPSSLEAVSQFTVRP